MKSNKSKNGISLIVLVITIIVMIILAAVIILSLNSSNITGRANEAKQAGDIANKKEAATLFLGEYQLKVAKGKIDGSKVSATDYVKEKLEAKGLDASDVMVTDSGEILVGANTYTDKNGDKAVIPEGFVVSKADGENTIEGGLVIYEGTEPVTNANVDTARETRNQFVWIPVDDMKLFKRTTTYIGTTIVEPDSSYSEPFSGTETDDSTGEWAEYNAMKDSVQKNGGFYIARYEAGIEGTNTVVSKKGVTVWSNVPWGSSMTEIGTNGAVYKARQMYKNSKSVVSTLCYGVQWDSALQFISTKDPDYALSSAEKGNHTGNMSEAGSKGEYAVNNIYDMAGNVWEWTMETKENPIYEGSTNSGLCRITRGGQLWVHLSASGRTEFNVDFTQFGGFRVTLYIK